MPGDAWTSGDAYERYMGRWSRAVARGFVAWLALPPGLRWLDAGCGTGALGGAVATGADPAEVVGVDPAEAFVARAEAGPRATFAVGDATALAFPDARFDAVVTGLMLNFLPEPSPAAAELARVCAPGGTVAAYLWDYAAGMAMLRTFWDAAAELDPGAAALDEGRRFPLCSQDALRALWAGAGLLDVTTGQVTATATFSDFDDYWTPFLGGQGPAPGYVAPLDGPRREALRDLLRSRLDAGGPISLPVRAWAVRGTRPSG